MAKVLGPQPLGVWAADILANIGAPHTQNNVNSLAAWWACESGQGSFNSLNYNNIFNTEQFASSGNGYVPTTQVPTFPNYNTGLWATLMTMRMPFASPIIGALRADAARPEFAAAVGASGWGTNPGCISASTASAGIVGGTGLRPAGPAGGFKGGKVPAGSAAGAPGGTAAGCLPAASVILMPAAVAGAVALAELVAHLLAG